MTGLLNLLKDFLLKAVSFFFQSSLITVHWLTRFLKIRRCNCRKCRAQKELDKTLRELGAEVYFLSDKEADWRHIPAVKQQFSRVEEAERRVLELQKLSEAINRNYSDAVHRVRARYEEKRALMGKGHGSERQ